MGEPLSLDTLLKASREAYNARLSEETDAHVRTTLAMRALDSVLAGYKIALTRLCREGLGAFNAQQGTSWKIVIEESSLDMPDRWHNEFVLTLQMVYPNGKRPFDELMDEDEALMFQEVKPYVRGALDGTPYRHFKLIGVSFKSGYLK